MTFPPTDPVTITEPARIHDALTAERAHLATMLRRHKAAARAAKRVGRDAGYVGVVLQLAIGGNA